ncbi:hypothetical protein S14_218 [Shewanella sp. phage 1/4]|uniref:hypothetical protein n=1 Tax=Shewanella phage 1/4 TaxID=1458859 RepID=UPI0004F92284|nr:hypothetical protein S14_218 [Shewanella sp. phage 1/4]AHK11327.1 hypothetical protein S14_218 [Shewanella sp. phage 1/4]
MKTYLYTVDYDSSARGYNRTIVVYRIKNNQPLFVGSNNEINTASYKGDYAIACELISANDSHKMDNTGYRLQSKNIKILSI